MLPGLREAVAVLAPPCSCRSVLGVEIEHVEAGASPGRHANQLARVLRPQGAELVQDPQSRP